MQEGHFPRAAEVVEEEEEDGEVEDYGVSIGRHAMHKDADSDTASLKDTIREEDSKPGAGRRSLLSRVPTLPTLYRNILKCSLAYFLGSLFTYYTPLSRLIVELTQDGPGEKYPSAAGHMVATVYVFCAGLSPCLKWSRIIVPCIITLRRQSVGCWRRTYTASWASALRRFYPSGACIPTGRSSPMPDGSGSRILLRLFGFALACRSSRGSNFG